MSLVFANTLNGPERAFGLLSVVLTIVWPLLAIVKGVAINPELTALALSLECGLLLLGVFFRIRLQSEKIAKLLIALGFYLIILTSVSNLIVLRFPISELTLDPILQATDDAIGYNWTAFVVWLSERPLLGNSLAAIYNTSLFQMAALMAVLSLTGRDRTLYRFLTTAAIALFATVSFWMFMPSFGPAISQTIPPEAAEKITLVVNSEFQTQMLKRVEEGSTSVPPTTTLGSVAFPSYHTIMALLVVVYAWRTYAFKFHLLINIPMLPAILGQGAHYVVDVVSGIIVFVVSASIARSLVSGPESWVSPLAVSREQLDSRSVS